MIDMNKNALLNSLGKQLVEGSLNDPAVMQATEATPDFKILPWVNVIKIGGQSIMDRGRQGGLPLGGGDRYQSQATQNDSWHRGRELVPTYLQFSY